MPSTAVRRALVLFTFFLIAAQSPARAGCDGLGGTGGSCPGGAWSWRALPGDPRYPFLSTDDGARGLAFNPTTGNLLVASRTGGLGVHVLNGRTGAVLGRLNVQGVSSGTFAGNMIGVGDDGAIYLANLTTNSTTTPFRLYRWANESGGLVTGGNAAPTLVYSGDPTNGVTLATPVANDHRFGDTLDVRGAGENTRVLIGARAGNSSGTLAALLTPSNTAPNAFVSRAIRTNNPSGHLGLAFYDDDTYWTKVPNAPLRKMALDLSAEAAQATAVREVSGLDNTSAILGADKTTNHFALITSRTWVMLFDTADPASQDDLDLLVFLNSSNPNSNGVGALDFGIFGGSAGMYAMDTNNGILATEVPFVPEPAAAITILLLGTARLARRPRR